MKKIKIEQMELLSAGATSPASCLGGILLGVVGGAYVGFRASSFLGVGALWGTGIGAVVGGVIGGAEACSS